MKFEQITVVGVGLIGGSFALAVKKAGLARRILGCDGDSTLAKAAALGVIDGIDEALTAGDVSSSDLVYLAAPVGSIMEFLRTRGNRMKPGAVVTDAGSTKRDICRAAREGLPKELRFVGGHPMAGSHKSGVEFASADLFQGAPYAIVRDVEAGHADDEPDSATSGVADLAVATGARPFFISPERHDHVVARTSHAPQILSTALASAISKAGGAEMLELAGNGFAEMTRLAESGWPIWEDICRTNADEIADALNEVIAELEVASGGIARRELSVVRKAFEAAGDFVRRHQQTRRDAS